MKFFDELLCTKETVEIDMWLYMELGARIVVLMGAYPAVISKPSAQEEDCCRSSVPTIGPYTLHHKPVSKYLDPVTTL